MLLRNFIFKMQHWSNRLSTNGFSNLNTDYNNAIKALNSLQSNAQFIKIAETQRLSHDEEYSKSILQSEKYFIRSGFTLQTLDTLPVIHIAGTKGKGSTCALCESILRRHGLKTGFYSSPHLFEVRERIRINGKPIHKQEFAKHFWNLYDALEKQKEDSNDMPMYFKFLTILAFKVFLLEKVDVAIIEAGIGGQYDSTNILRFAELRGASKSLSACSDCTAKCDAITQYKVVPVVGITSLGLDHTNILGNSIEEIAWHKAGIMKPNSQVFTVSQLPNACKVLQNRSSERSCTLQVVELIENLPTPREDGGPNKIFQLNASLAIALATAWLKNSGRDTSVEALTAGIVECKWPGRYQLLRLANNYYLDGAHTLESIQVCASWFIEKTVRSPYERVLIFNLTGARNSQDFLAILKACNFDTIFFVPNKATSSNSEDNKSFNVADTEQMDRCYMHQKLWIDISKGESKKVLVLPSIFDALFQLETQKYEILITGSLYLVGAALSLLDPDLKNSETNER